MMQKLLNLYKKYKEIIIYVFFGGTATIVNFVVYSVCVGPLSTSLEFGGAIAWAVAVIYAFFTNKIWVFESHDWKINTLIKEGVSFIGGRLFTGVIEIYGTPLLVSWGINQVIFGIPGFVAKAVVAVIVIVLNYVLSKLFVFKNQKG